MLLTPNAWAHLVSAIRLRVCQVASPSVATESEGTWLTCGTTAKHPNATNSKNAYSATTVDGRNIQTLSTTWRQLLTQGFEYFVHLL